MRTVMLSSKTLRALVHAVSKDQTRYYLGGVYVETDGRTVTYCATDGHIMLANQHDCEQVDEPLVGKWIIPSEICSDKRLKKANDYVAFYESPTELTLADMIVKPIDGSFPDWRRVVPTKVSGEPAQYNPSLLVKLQKAGEIFDHKIPSVGYNGDSPALITWEDTLFGVIMPMRRVAEATLPLWFSPPRSNPGVRS
jgi:DNA polymerase-3 subunit beta